jgi:L,D-transpeptidase ErfK/SrfK
MSTQLPQNCARRGVVRSRTGVRLVIALLGWLSAAVRAETFLIAPDGDLIGAVGSAQAAYEDTLTDIARRTGLGYEDVVRANPRIDPWLPGKGTAVVLPTQYVLPTSEHRGLVVNIAEYRIYYFYDVSGQRAVATFPISIGRMDWSTPLGMHSIISKTRRPTWRPPESIRDEHAADGRFLAREVPPGPDNPLGEYAMRLNYDGYLIHGTNRPVGIGMRVTHGCVRMYPEDIEWLYSRVAVNTPVLIVNQPYKFGWMGNNLYLEVHPPLDEDESADERGLTELTQLFVRATTDRPAEVDWSLVNEVYRQKQGIPVRVGSAVQSSKAAATAAGTERRDSERDPG